MAQTIKKKSKKGSGTPLVSVVMSVYNGEKYLREAIDSILNQTFMDFEFVIIDDGSTDNTLEILKSYSDPRILLISRENKGLVASLNEGIEMARGKYIARMDADDISHKKRLEYQLQMIESSFVPTVVATLGLLIDDQGTKRGTYLVPYLQPDLARRFYIGNSILHGSAMYPRDAVLQNGLYSDSVGPVEDYDLWTRLDLLSFSVVPKMLYSYRVNEEGVSIQRSTQQLRGAKIVRDELWRNNNLPGLRLFGLWSRIKTYKTVNAQIVFDLLSDQKMLIKQALKRNRFFLAFKNLLNYLTVKLLNKLI
ncbi:glycosyltransferase family 2 protein [bacterium]|nr:glycosyltransferase family 2 protein [bacterium]